MIELMLEAERALSVGLVDQAEHLFWQAVEADGRNVIAIVGLAKVALARGDDRTAFQFARKALELDPEDGAASRLVERLEDLERLRTGAAPALKVPTDGPAGVAIESAAADEAAAAPVPAPADSADDSQPPSGTPQDPAPTASPAAKRSRADIEWPATDFLGAAPSVLSRTRPSRPVAAGTPGAPGMTPPEPRWPAVLPPTAASTEPVAIIDTRDAEPTPAEPTRAEPAPAEPTTDERAPAERTSAERTSAEATRTEPTPAEPEKKRGLMNRFRRNG